MPRRAVEEAAVSTIIDIATVCALIYVGGMTILAAGVWLSRRLSWSGSRHERHDRG
jgi:hypothetical protein